MSNVAGKAQALNVWSPTRRRGIENRVIFLALRFFFKKKLNGLLTLSLIHYARWVIVSPKDFPNLGEGQPEEDLSYSYECFLSNFNGNWDQYIDSFSMSIGTGLDMLWYKNIGFPNSIPIEPFHAYINANSIPTDHYYNAYPLAACNDVKAAQRVRETLLTLSAKAASLDPKSFRREYDAAVISRQDDLSRLDQSIIVSLATQAVDRQERQEAY